MILRQLIDLLNSGEAVSIVGSGVSADAGVPTWNSLLNSVADALDHEQHDTQAAGKSGRPSFAFIGYEDRSANAKEHQDSLRANYNVEVIPYLKQDGNHADLQRVLEGYARAVRRAPLGLSQTRWPSTADI